jgi:hypothetical protein
MAAFLGSLATAMFLVGCATPIPPGAERGPDGTMAYDILVEASSPGVRIEADGKYAGDAPLHLKVFGDPDGTFHDFGDYHFKVRAIPAPGATNEYVQTSLFQTGRLLSSEDEIPERIYFQMNQPPPKYVPYPVYVTPPSYYDPFYYDRFYYGPSFRFNLGPRYYHHGHPGHHRHH